MMALVGPYPFDTEFMVRALIAGLVVGMCAPLVGTFVVQRKLSLIGDGLGHVAAAGVGIALWVDVAPTPIAIIATIIAACLIEWIIKVSKNPDTALALIFYSGIAASITFAGRNSRQGELPQYLFGSLLSITNKDVLTISIVCIVISLIVITLSKLLIAIAVDESSATISGIPTRLIRILLMICVALIVSISMTITGLLLISAVMVIPVLTARLFANSFKSAWFYSVLIGGIGSLIGLIFSRTLNTAPGGTIVLVHVGFFVLVNVYIWSKKTISSRSLRQI